MRRVLTFLDRQTTIKLSTTAITQSPDKIPQVSKQHMVPLQESDSSSIRDTLSTGPTEACFAASQSYIPLAMTPEKIGVHDGLASLRTLKKYTFSSQTVLRLQQAQSPSSLHSQSTINTVTTQIAPDQLIAIATGHGQALSLENEEHKAVLRIYANLVVKEKRTRKNVVTCKECDTSHAI